jgi:hypothetical protein
MMFSHEFTLITCCKNDCGITFAVPNWWNQGKRETRKTFYCPNGHPQSFTGASDIEKARRERDIARQQVARAEQEAAEALARAQKAELAEKKLKKCASAGTCPCCSRTFSNMATHMKRQHPTFVEEGGAKVISIKATK